MKSFPEIILFGWVFCVLIPIFCRALNYSEQNETEECYVTELAYTLACLTPIIWMTKPMRDHQNFDYYVKHYDPNFFPKTQNQTKTTTKFLKPNQKQQQQQTPKIQVAEIQQTNEYTVLKLCIALQFHMNHDAKSGPEKSNYTYVTSFLFR